MLINRIISRAVEHFFFKKDKSVTLLFFATFFGQALFFIISPWLVSKYGADGFGLFAISYAIIAVGGSLAAFKIDSLIDGYEIFRVLLTNICNNTLLCFSSDTWNTINGISFSSKKIDNIKDDNYCVIIKLWFKLNFITQNSIDKYINPHINELIKKYSIKIKAIKPEY